MSLTMPRNSAAPASPRMRSVNKGNRMICSKMGKAQSRIRIRSEISCIQELLRGERDQDERQDDQIFDAGAVSIRHRFRRLTTMFAVHRPLEPQTSTTT